MRPSKREPSMSSGNENKIKGNLVDKMRNFDFFSTKLYKTFDNFFKNFQYSLMATSASRSFENLTTPVSKPRISANFTSPTSRNLSRRFCHVHVDGSCEQIFIKIPLNKGKFANDVMMIGGGGEGIRPEWPPLLL